MGAKASRPVMSPTAGFHANERRGELRDKGHHLRTIKPFAHQNRAVLIHPHEVKHLFCNVDTDDAKLLLHGTRLLWLNGFTHREPIVAHCRRSAQGRVHFIMIVLLDPEVCRLCPVLVEILVEG